MKLSSVMAGNQLSGGVQPQQPQTSIPAKLQPGDMVVPAQVIQHIPDHVKQSVLGAFKHVGLDPAKFFASAPSDAQPAPAQPNAVPTQ